MWALLVLAGISSMRAAMARGDVDEAARQGALAGPAVVERALKSTDELVVRAGIAAAPIVEDRAELIEPLARLAATGSAKVAGPAAAAAVMIARDFARRERPDDIAGEDVAAWRAAWAAIALAPARAGDLRVLALEVAAALDPNGMGVSLEAGLADPDPLFRRAVIGGIAAPAPAAVRTPLANAIANDADDGVALVAAQAYCASVDAAGIEALGDAATARIAALVKKPTDKAAARDAKQCLTSKPATRRHP